MTDIKPFWRIILFMTVAGLMISCTTEEGITAAEEENTPTEETLSYLQENLFNGQCAVSGCHDSGAKSANLDLSAGNAHGNLVNVPAVLSGSGLKRVEPGNSAQSFLIKVLDGSDPTQMPIGRPALDAATIDKIKAWIDAGAMDN